jgi:hypothetical protein
MNELQSYVQTPTVLVIIELFSILIIIWGLIFKNHWISPYLTRSSIIVFVFTFLYLIIHGPEPLGSTDPFSSWWWNFYLG